MLYQLPEKDKFEESYFNENAFFNFLIRYIALPFIYVYFIILYAYIIKVLMNFSDWPKGEVSWMVIGFSTFGYITYIFSYIFEVASKKESHKLIILFRKYFPYAMLAPIAMLFYAIFLRIGQYDITINRYFVVAFGIWLLVISLYMIISQKKSLIYIPAILTLFTLVISIGPWSVYNLPLIRQTQRLQDNLISAGILNNGVITPLENISDIDEQLSGQIYDGIEYVCGLDNCNAIKEMFSVIYTNIAQEDEDNFYENQKKYNRNTSSQYS
jgi:hypothetical protein